MKKLILAACVAALLHGCGGCKKNSPLREGETVITETTIISDGHNARNSLDYWGTYRGTVPCADCEGIQMKLTLKEDGSYELLSIYLGRPSKREVEARGTFTWNDAGDTITLSGIDAPNQFFVGENMLIILDKEGNRVTGELAGRYILKK